MKVLIIDNDASIIEGLKAMLKKLCPQVTQLSEANGVESGIKELNRYKPDIVFMDVEMDDGTGFDLINKLGYFDFQLIFITAYNKYAVNAFKLSAIDFLLKPIDPSELVVSVNRALANMNKKELEKQVKLLQESIQTFTQINGQEKKIALNDGGIIHYIKISEIIYLKADGSYTTFFLSSGRKVMVSHLLKEYEDLFSDLNFIRTHHSFLINASKISKFDKSDGGQLIMEEKHNVPVSARKKEQVLEALRKF